MGHTAHVLLYSGFIDLSVMLLHVLSVLVVLSSNCRVVFCCLGIVCFSIYQFRNFWAANFELLWIKLLWTFAYTFLLEHIFVFILVYLLRMRFFNFGKQIDYFKIILPSHFAVYENCSHSTSLVSLDIISLFHFSCSSECVVSVYFQNYFCNFGPFI